MTVEGIEEEGLGRSLRFVVFFLVGIVMPVFAQSPLSIQNTQLVVSVRADGSYQIQSKGLRQAVLEARIGAKIGGKWLRSTDYAQHRSVESSFGDALGQGKQIVVTFTGFPVKPDLVCILRLYNRLPMGTVEVRVQNNTTHIVSLQKIRLIEALGEPRVNLGGRQRGDRVLSDKFNFGPATNYVLGEAPGETDRGVWTQLIYNRGTHESLLLAALTARRFVTIMNLGVNKSSPAGPRIDAYTVESAGTNEVLSRGMKLSVSLPPGKELSSERLMFAVGRHYHAQLALYGKAVAQLNHPRIAPVPMMGWWSWTAFFRAISEGSVLTNAQWLTQHLRSAGYNWFFIDAGYQYARGEYTSPNLAQFPHGMEPVSHAICRLGLNFGVWVSPLEVSTNAWVYRHHKDWLVHDADGRPLEAATVPATTKALYVLDTTNPAAQAYLRQTYQTLVHEWGVQYIKMDYWGESAIEGYRYRPNTTALEAQRIGFSIIREAVGNHVLLDKDGGPPLPFVGFADMGRIADDTAHFFGQMKRVAAGLAARYYMNGNFFRADPDAFGVSREVLPPGRMKVFQTRPLTLNEAEVSIALAALSGGMFEIGDDLPTLGSEPDRLALVRNPDLLQMAQLGLAAVPLDLMTFRAQDLQPSLFLLVEDRRQRMLGIFNWSDHSLSRKVSLAELGVPLGHICRAYDVFNHDQAVALSDNSLALDSQSPHSVRLIKIIDTSIPATPPNITARVPAKARLTLPVKFSATVAGEVPVLAYHWDFGDGTGADGPEVTHTYTISTTFTVRLAVKGVDGISVRQSFPITVRGKLNILEPNMLR